MRREWKKSLLVFKMSQRSLFECGISKSKAGKSDLADNAESVPTSASSDQPQQPTKNQKPSSATTGKTHSRASVKPTYGVNYVLKSPPYAEIQGQRRPPYFQYSVMYTQNQTPRRPLQ